MRACTASASGAAARALAIAAAERASAHPLAHVMVPDAGPMRCQRRWDTSPYRRLHRLNYNFIQRARWPASGSLAWRPRFHVERPLPPELIVSSVPTAAATAWDAGGPEVSLAAPQRLHQRLLENLNISASDAMMLIQRSRVTLNGRVQRADRWVSAADTVHVNGHPVEELAGFTLIAHKPSGFALTEDDPLRRKSYTLLLPDPSIIVRPVRRLDLPSSGLLVITNNMSLAAAASGLGRSPWPATFLVLPREPLAQWQVAELRSPAPWPYAACGASQAPEAVDEGFDAETGEQALRFILSVGGAAEIRRAFSAVGAPPPAGGGILCSAIGPLTLEGLDLEEPGATRLVPEPDVAQLLSLGPPVAETGGSAAITEA